MLDYKSIILKSFVLHMSGAEIAAATGASKSGVNDFLKAFRECKNLDFPLPEGITNQKIFEKVYGEDSIATGRDSSIELPDYAYVDRKRRSKERVSMTSLWNEYVVKCHSEGKRAYQYRQFYEHYTR